MFKKILLLLILSFILVSCGDDTKNESKSLLQTFKQKDFVISIPGSWEVFKSNDKIFPKPAFGEIVFDAKANKKTNNFYRNILILKQNKIQNNSLDYSIGNYIGGIKNYFYSKLIGEKKVVIDSKKTKIYEFEAKYSEDTPIATFIQTGIVCDNHYGYILTIALEKGNKNLGRYEKLLGTFKCSSDTNSLKKIIKNIEK